MIPLPAPPCAPRRPGEILKEALDACPELTQGVAAQRLRLSRPHLNEVLNRKEKRITPEVALRLSRFFSTSAEFWLYAQADWDLHRARGSRRVMRVVHQVQPWEGAIPASLAAAGALAVPAAAEAEEEGVDAAAERRIPDVIPREQVARRLRERLRGTAARGETRRAMSA